VGHGLGIKNDLGLDFGLEHDLGLGVGPSYNPWGGCIIPSLLKRICPQIKRIL